MTDRTHPDSGLPSTRGDAGYTASDMATAAAQGFRDGVASVVAENTNTERDLGFSLENRGGVWVVQDSMGGCRPASLYEQKLWAACQQARASLSLPAAGQEPVALEWDEVFDRAVAAYCRSDASKDALRLCFQSRNQQSQISCGWTANELMAFAMGIHNLAAPQPAVAAGWVSVDDRLPEPYEHVLAHNGKWTGVAAWMSGEYLEPLERWQDEHREFIEMMGPAITHWMKLPEPPNGSN